MMDQESDLPAGLGKPARRAFAGAGYVRLRQFTRVGEDEASNLHGMGPRAVGQIRRALLSMGRSFAAGPSSSVGHDANNKARGDNS